MVLLLTKMAGSCIPRSRHRKSNLEKPTVYLKNTFLWSVSGVLRVVVLLDFICKSIMLRCLAIQQVFGVSLVPCFASVWVGEKQLRTSMALSLTQNSNVRVIQGLIRGTLVCACLHMHMYVSLFVCVYVCVCGDTECLQGLRSDLS